MHWECQFQCARNIAEISVESASNETMDFSPHERRIINDVADGLLNKQIAAKYRLKEQTVKNELSRIYVKARVANRAQLVSFWMLGKFDERTKARRLM